jgi:hypothetical protein
VIASLDCLCCSAMGGKVETGFPGAILCPSGRHTPASSRDPVAGRVELGVSVAICESLVLMCVSASWACSRETSSVDARGRDGFTRAGVVGHRGLDLPPPALPPGRVRHRYGEGPFARLQMPWVPDWPGLYLWDCDGQIVYVGQTRTPIRVRLGSRGYSTISNYNTFAPEPGRNNRGQETNCRVNHLANQALASGAELVIWYRQVDRAEVRRTEANWIAEYGLPPWNRRA